MKVASRTDRVVRCPGDHVKRSLTLLAAFLFTTNGAFAEPVLVVNVKVPSGVYRQEDHRGHQDFSRQFHFSFEVTTPSTSRQEFSSWRCGIYRNWITDNPDVSIEKWSCTRDGIYAQEVRRDKPFRGEVSIKVREGIRGAMKFRVAFAPFTRDSASIYPPKELGVFWSNPIELDVID